MRVTLTLNYNYGNIRVLVKNDHFKSLLLYYVTHNAPSKTKINQTFRKIIL